jgi:hypothetical protein
VIWLGALFVGAVSGVLVFWLAWAIGRVFGAAVSLALLSWILDRGKAHDGGEPGPATPDLRRFDTRRSSRPCARVIADGTADPASRDGATARPAGSR